MQAKGRPLLAEGLVVFAFQLANGRQPQDFPLVRAGSDSACGKSRPSEILWVPSGDNQKYAGLFRAAG